MYDKLTFSSWYGTESFKKGYFWKAIHKKWVKSQRAYLDVHALVPLTGFPKLSINIVLRVFPQLLTNQNGVSNWIESNRVDTIEGHDVGNIDGVGLGGLEHTCHLTRATIATWFCLHASSRIYNGCRFDSTHVNGVMV